MRIQFKLVYLRMNFNNAHEALKQKEVTIHPKKKQDQRTQLILLQFMLRCYSPNYCNFQPIVSLNCKYWPQKQPLAHSLISKFIRIISLAVFAFKL